MTSYEPNTLTIPVEHVQPGDSLSSSYQNGRGGYAGIGIGSVSHYGDTVTLNGAVASYDYPAGTLVTVERW